MTPYSKYHAILTDVQRFFHDRAQRYFEVRYAGGTDELLKVQCDTIMVLLKTYLEPQVVWFEAYEERLNAESTQALDEALLTGDRDAEILRGANDAS